MTNYALLNLILVFVSVIVLVLCRNSFFQIIRNAKLALFLVLISFPWDYFAIKLQLWIHPEYPGYKIFEVPINEMIFVFLCTFITFSIFSAVFYKPQKRSKGDTEAKNN